MSFIIWIITGAIAGWLAGKVVKGRDFGLVGNIIIGLVGAFVGGWLFNALGISVHWGILGDIFISFVGAVVLIVALRFLSRVAN